MAIPDSGSERANDAIANPNTEGIDHEEDVPPGSEDAVLAELTEEVTRRLESGEPVNGGDLGENSDRAGPIRRLLPALRTMVSLGKQVAREEGSRTRLQKKKNGPSSSFVDTNPEVEESNP